MSKISKWFRDTFIGDTSDSQAPEGQQPSDSQPTTEQATDNQPADNTQQAEPSKEEPDKPETPAKEDEPKTEEKPEEVPKEEPKDSKSETAPDKSEDSASIMAKAKKLIESDEKYIEDVLPCFEEYVRKHHAYREVVVLAAPRRKLEKRYRDRIKPGNRGLLKLKEVESILKEGYPKAERDDAFKVRFEEVECYADGTPASEEDIEAWNRMAKTPSPGATPSDGSSGGDSSAV